ncbi:ATP-dependent endonuclease [Halobacteriota archaeon]
MKIKKIHIKNFKSLKDVEIDDVGDLNIFIGKNNSGKSNIIGALLFLSDIAGKQLSEVFNEHGQYEEIVFGKYVDDEIIFDMEFAISDKDISTLFSKLQLGVSQERFKKYILNKVRYFIKLKKEHGIQQEEIYIYPGQETLYAKGFMNEKGRYEHQIIEDFTLGIKKEEWNLISFGEGSPPTSILRAPTNHSPIRLEENLLVLLREFIFGFNQLNPVRESPEVLGIQGVFQLKPDASNLPQVLNSIASSNRRVFDEITESAGDIIEKINEIRASIIEATQNTHISIVEPPFDNTEFKWKNIASGTKEILYLTTLLHTTPKGSVLMIEEPEIHLHPDAIRKLLSLTEKICERDEKQILITTHSPILTNGSSFGKTSLVTKIEGVTDVASLASDNFDKISAELGIRKSDIFQSDAIVLVEGESDKRILNIWADTLGLNIDKYNIEIMSVGGKDSMKFYANASAFKVSKTPFKVILDNDGNDPETIKRKLLGEDKNGKKLKAPDEKAVCEESDIYILGKYSIESYLLDSKAISKEYDLNEEDVSQFLTSISREDKKSVLNELFKKFLGRKYHEVADGSTIASNIENENIDQEIKDLIENKIITLVK